MRHNVNLMHHTHSNEVPSIEEMQEHLQKYGVFKHLSPLLLSHQDEVLGVKCEPSQRAWQHVKVSPEGLIHWNFLTPQWGLTQVTTYH